eukprot:12125603-Alexandrium_andersonii.AAC.1
MSPLQPRLPKPPPPLPRAPLLASACPIPENGAVFAFGQAQLRDPACDPARRLALGRAHLRAGM